MTRLCTIYSVHKYICIEGVHVIVLHYIIIMYVLYSRYTRWLHTGLFYFSSFLLALVNNYVITAEGKTTTTKGAEHVYYIVLYFIRIYSLRATVGSLWWKKLTLMSPPQLVYTYFEPELRPVHTHDPMTTKTSII